MRRRATDHVHGLRLGSPVRRLNQSVSQSRRARMTSVSRLTVRAVTVLVIAIIAMMFGSGSASATHVQCGDVITQDTTLDSDLVCAGDGLTILGERVTLDLAGHSMTGLGTGTRIAPAGGS